MDLFYHKQIGIDDCMETERFTISHLKPEQTTLKIHIHDCYELYYSISGGREFFISNQYYEIHPGDVFFICPGENHHITHLEDVNHERINLAIHPKFLERYSTPSTPLATCFNNHENRVIHLSLDMQKRFKILINKIAQAKGFGSDLLENMYLCELLILLENCWAEPGNQYRIGTNPSNSTVQTVLQYINTHLTEDLSLECLSKEFFVSQSYLCRTFKSYTGITINKYISARRISLATALMNTGIRPSDVYLQVGFKNYNNFFKTFVEIVGMSPKNYMISN